MKSPLTRLKPYLAQAMTAGREAAAAPMAPEALRDKLTEFAKLGFAECRIHPLAPVDVRATVLVAAGEKYLNHEGMRFTWEAQTPPLENPAGARAEFFVLVVQLI